MPHEVSLTLARFSTADRERWLTAAITLLSDDERSSLESIADLDTRTQHALGRALIRRAGAAAAGVPCAEVRITVSPAGKPELAGLGVSIAHSEGTVVLASCAGSAVGVDIESVRDDPAATRRLIERRFASSEAAAARHLSDDRIGEWFARIWTIKEAVGKALGIGVFPALSGVVVAGDGDSLELTATPSGPPAASWTLHQLSAAEGRERIAVAMPTPNVELAAVTRLSVSEFRQACV